MSIKTTIQIETEDGGENRWVIRDLHLSWGVSKIGEGHFEDGETVIKWSYLDDDLTLRLIEYHLS